MKFVFILFVLFFILKSYSQSIDVRRSLWGASSADVKKAELPLIPSLEKDSNIISQKQANKIVTYNNVVVEKKLAQIDYFFRNDRLIAICFTLQQKKDSASVTLYEKINQVQGIFNKFVQIKGMKPIYCWTYDNGSFKQQSRKTACTFADKTTATELEQYSATLSIVNRALFVLGNDRSLASFEFDIKNNDNNVLCWINFTPTKAVEQTLQSTDF